LWAKEEKHKEQDILMATKEKESQQPEMGNPQRKHVR
ncbi:hypothetical protein LCGC14_2664090, partial [marine sediment metagenome]